MNTKNIKFSVLRLSLCCVLWGTSCLLFVYVRRFSKHFYSIIFTEALWKCFYMKNWNLYFIFHHEKYCWMDFYKYAFCFFSSFAWAKCSALALAGCVFLRLFYTLPSTPYSDAKRCSKSRLLKFLIISFTQIENCFLKFELLRSDLRLVRFLIFLFFLYVTNSSVWDFFARV